MKSVGRKRREDELEEERAGTERAGTPLTPAQELLAMQQTAGNQAVARMLHAKQSVARQPAEVSAGPEQKGASYELEFLGTDPAPKKGKAPKNKIVKIESLQFGQHRGITAPGGGGVGNRDGKAPEMHEIVITKFADQESSWIFQESLQGKARDIVIRAKSDGKTYMTITLKNALMGGVQWSGGESGGQKPLETVTLNATSIQTEMQAQPGWSGPG